MSEIVMGEWRCRLEPLGVACKHKDDADERIVYIGPIIHSSKTEKLYDLEQKRDDLIQQAADEYLRVSKREGHNRKWTEGIPTELFNTLESFSQNVSIPACIAYLYSKGILID